MVQGVMRGQYLMRRILCYDVLEILVVVAQILVLLVEVQLVKRRFVAKRRYTTPRFHLLQLLLSFISVLIDAPLQALRHI